MPTTSRAGSAADHVLPLSPEQSAQLDRWYPLVIDQAIRAARGLGALESDAEDRVHLALGDLIAGWTRRDDPLPFPTSQEHLRGLLIKRLRCRVIDAKRRLATLRTTGRLGTPADDTPLEDVVEPLTTFSATCVEGERQESEDDRLQIEILDAMIDLHLRELPPKTRDVFFNLFDCQRPREFVAQLLGMSIKTVDWHREVALKHLRAGLRNQGSLGWGVDAEDVENTRWLPMIRGLAARLDARQEQRRASRPNRGASHAA